MTFGPVVVGDVGLSGKHSKVGHSPLLNKQDNRVFFFSLGGYDILKAS